MSFIKAALIASGMTVAFAAHAMAQDTGPWDVKDRTAYIVMMDGAMKTMALSDKGIGMLMKNAKLVPHGTVFLMSKGQLYMVDASSMFDKAGMPTFGGGF